MVLDTLCTKGPGFSVAYDHICCLISDDIAIEFSTEFLKVNGVASSAIKELLVNYMLEELSVH